MLETKIKSKRPCLYIESLGYIFAYPIVVTDHSPLPHDASRSLSESKEDGAGVPTSRAVRQDLSRRVRRRERHARDITA